MPINAPISLFWTFMDTEKRQKRVVQLFNPHSILLDHHLRFVGDAAVGHQVLMTESYENETTVCTERLSGL